MKEIKYMVRDAENRQYHQPLKGYPEIEFFLESNQNKKIGHKIMTQTGRKNYQLDNIKYYKNQITYYFTEIDKIKEKR